MQLESNLFSVGSVSPLSRALFSKTSASLADLRYSMGEKQVNGILKHTNLRFCLLFIPIALKPKSQ